MLGGASHRKLARAPTSRGNFAEHPPIASSEGHHTSSPRPPLPSPPTNRTHFAPQTDSKSGTATSTTAMAPNSTKKTLSMATAVSARKKRAGGSGFGFVAAHSLSKTYGRNDPPGVRVLSRAAAAGGAQTQGQNGCDKGNNCKGTGATEKDVAKFVARSPPKKRAPTIPPDTPSTAAMTLKTADSLATTTTVSSEGDSPRHALATTTQSRVVSLTSHFERLATSPPIKDQCATAIATAASTAAAGTAVTRNGQNGGAPHSRANNFQLNSRKTLPSQLPSIKDESASNMHQQQDPRYKSVTASTVDTEPEPVVEIDGSCSRSFGEAGADVESDSDSDSEARAGADEPTGPLHLQPEPVNEAGGKEDKNESHVAGSGLGPSSPAEGDKRSSIVIENLPFDEKSTCPLIDRTIIQGNGSFGDASSLTSHDFESDIVQALPPLPENGVGYGYGYEYGSDACAGDPCKGLGDKPIADMDSPPALHRKHSQLSYGNTTSTGNSGTDSESPTPNGHRTGRRAPRPESSKILREARLAMYQNSINSQTNSTQGDATEAELRLAHARNKIAQQEQTISRLQQQITLQKKTLDSTNAELESARESVQQKQSDFTDYRAQAVQERNRWEHLYQSEVEHAQKNEAQIAKLQTEVSTLKVSLRTARSESTRLVRQYRMRTQDDKQRSHRNPQSPPNDQDEQIAELNTELSRLKKSGNVPHAAVEAVRQKLRQSQAEVVKLREKEKESRRSYDRQAEQIKKLNAKIKASEDAERTARAEVSKMKADVQRLTTQHNISSERSSKELEKARKELQEVQRKSRTEILGLKASFLASKQKLTKANDERLLANEEQLKDSQKVQIVLSRLNADAEELQEKFSAQEDKIAQLETELEEARSHTNKRGTLAEHRISVLEDELRLSRASEENLRIQLKFGEHSPSRNSRESDDASHAESDSLRVETSRLKEQLADAECKIEQNQALREEIRLLKGTIEELKDALEDRSEMSEQSAQTGDGYRATSHYLTPVSPVASSIHDSVEIPNNVARLRKELSEAKDRLLAARNKTRIPDPQEQFLSLSWVFAMPPNHCGEDEHKRDHGNENQGNSSFSASGDEEMLSSSRMLVPPDDDACVVSRIPFGEQPKPPPGGEGSTITSVKSLITATSDHEIEVSRRQYADI